MFKRQIAFEKDSSKFLKGGLHCHTTRSDGRLTPEEVIRLHAQNGYDFLALTDHRFYNFKNYAPETGVMILPGMEIDASITSRDGMCFHTVAIGPEESKNGYRQDERVDSRRVQNQTEFQPLVDSVLAHNNLAFYCHPDWSSTPARSFENINGYFAMEIWNSGCAIVDDMDTDNGLIWDELLVRGHRMGCVAVDDGHAPDQHCKGWVMVDAEKTPDSVLAALKEGRYYSSCGPVIKDFYVRDDRAYLECSPVKMIKFVSGENPSPARRAVNGELITCFEANAAGCRYVRAVVEDELGRRAWTNPIWIEE